MKLNFKKVEKKETKDFKRAEHETGGFKHFMQHSHEINLIGKNPFETHETLLKKKLER